jgi:hypothetical protein
VNLALIPVFKPHTHTLYILRHCPNIVEGVPEKVIFRDDRICDLCNSSELEDEFPPAICYNVLTFQMKDVKCFHMMKVTTYVQVYKCGIHSRHGTYC